MKKKDGKVTRRIMSRAPRGRCRRPSIDPVIGFIGGYLVILALLGAGARSDAQQPESPHATAGSASPSGGQLDVNWLYGAYVPRDVPLTALSMKERLDLYKRQTFTTPGIYIKTAIFSVADQWNDSPPEWGSGISGYGRRVGSSYAQFVLQNTFTAVADAGLGYEPRYDRARTSGVWPRIRHAVVRNFVTYDRSESSLRPQIGLYASAFGAGAMQTTWLPGHTSVVHGGLKGMESQALYGCFADLLGEFAEDAERYLHKRPAAPPG
jgi:hypothetical protein